MVLLGIYLLLNGRGESQAMFEAAVSKFSESIGKDTLHPVPSFDQADSCNLYSVVVKKKRRWFWQSPKYETSEFNLASLLIDKDIDGNFGKVKVEHSVLEECNKNYNFKLTGKIGGNLKALFEVEFSGTDTVVVQTDFKNVDKAEADTAELLELVKTFKLDLAHDYITQVRQDPRKVLCLIYGVWSTTEESTITTSIQRDIKENVDANVPGGTAAKIDEGGELSDSTKKMMKIPKGVPLAYRAYELIVKSDGSMTLVMDRDVAGGFRVGQDTTDGVDVIVKGAQIDEMCECYKGILSLPDKDKSALREHTIKICHCPSDVDFMLALVKKGYKACNGVASVTEEQLQKLFNEILHQADAKAVLTMVGFTFKDNKIAAPSTSSDVLDSTRSLFEALVEISDEATALLPEITENTAKTLFYVLGRLVNDEEVSKSDKKAELLFKNTKEGKTVKNIVENIGIVEEGKALNGKTMDLFQVQGTLRAVFCLWLDKEMAEKIKDSSAEETRRQHKCCII